MPKSANTARTSSNRNDSLTGRSESEGYFPMSLGVSLGKAEGVDVFQQTRDRVCHTIVLGRSGSGKTNLIHQMEREDILSGAGCAIIASNLQDALYPLECIPPERMRDTIVIDCTDTEFLPCLNPLGVDRTDRDAANRAVESALELLKSGSMFEWAGPRFDARARLILSTIMDPHFPEEPSFAMLERTANDPELVKEWLKSCRDRILFDQWTKTIPAAKRSSDEGEVNEWFLSKVSPFTTNATISAMFRAGKKTINFQEVVDKSKILVVLAPEAFIGAEACRIIKTWVIMELRDAIMKRGGSGSGCGQIRSAQRNVQHFDPFYIYVDEFGEVASDEFATMIAQVRKQNVGFILSFQGLKQLNAFNPKEGKSSDRLLQSVLGNAGTVITYQVGVDDARILAERFGVKREKLQGIRNYRPVAMIRMDSLDIGPTTLEIPLKPESSDKAMPGRIMKNLIFDGTLCRARESALKRSSLKDFLAD